MGNINYQELLAHLFTKEPLTTTSKSWNYQSNGCLYLASNGNKPVKPIGCVPLYWERPFRIAQHPKENVYAYATSQTHNINNNETSCICLFYPDFPVKSKYYHRQSDYPNHGFDIKPAFSPDGKWIAFLSMKKYGMITLVGDVLVVPYDSNGKDVVNLTEKLAISGMCKEFQWSDNNTLLVEYCEKGFSKVCSISFDPNNPSFVAEPHVLGNFKLDSRVERGNYKYTQDFCSLNGNTQDLSFLNFGHVEHCEYKTTDGVTSYYWFARPNPDYNNGRTLLLCQGGPHHAWEPEIECGSFHIPLLQHLGYSIIMPIVRGMPGISQEFDDQVRGDWGGQCIKDYLSALDTAIEKFELDKNNVAVLGHSFGGFCAYSMNVQHPDRFRCVVSESGPFNLESFLSDSLTYDPQKGFIKNQTMVCEMYNGLANPEGRKIAEKMIREQSPDNLINNCKDRCKPILIIHGEDDKRVPCEQSKTAAEAFNVAPILYQGEKHCILKPQNIIDRYNKILTFLDDHMK